MERTGRLEDVATVRRREAAILLGVTQAQAVQLMADGTLTRCQRGREVLVDRTEVERFGGVAGGAARRSDAFSVSLRRSARRR
jgi:excisionase family DNA binding protein